MIKNSQDSRSSHPEVFLEKGILKICSKFTGEHACRSAVSRRLVCNFIEIALLHGCSPVYLLHIFWTPFSKNTSGRLLLKTAKSYSWFWNKNEFKTQWSFLNTVSRSFSISIDFFFFKCSENPLLWKPMTN